MLNDKKRRFQMCDHNSRLRNYPVDQFIFSETRHDIVSLYNKSFEDVFENATGHLVNIMIHPNFNNPYNNVMQLLQFTINFTIKFFSSTSDRELELFLGMYDVYLIPVIRISGSESLLPAFKTDEKLWVAEAEMTGSPTYFIEMFHFTLWLMFIVFFLTIGCLSAFAFNRLKKFSTASSDTFTWFSMITQQGAETRPKFISLQLVLFSLSILTIMFYGSFEAFMSSYLAMPKPDLPFNDITSLLKAKDYSICIPTSSKDVYEYVETNLIVNEMHPNRINSEQCPTFFSARILNLETFNQYNRNCPVGKTAIIAANLWGLFNNNEGTCRIMLLPGGYFPSYIGVPVSLGFKYQEHFKREIIRQMSAGHTKYIHKKLDRRTNMQKTYTYVINDDKASINLHQTKLVFGILLCGIVFSFLVLVVEKIIANYLQHRISNL